MSQPAAGASGLPRHVAVIMDGNGRWAQRRALPRHLGHRAGAKAVRATVEGCARRGVEALTIFAFSSENWQRPQDEVTRLMELFVESIDKEIDELHRNGIRVRFIGELSRLREGLGAKIAAAEARTAGNRRMTLFIAVSYGGRWDIVEAARGWRQAPLPGASSLKRSTKPCSPTSCSWRARPNRTCSSAPVASSASAISCCGTSPTPNSISATRCGPTSTTPRSTPRCVSLPAGNDDSA